MFELHQWKPDDLLKAMALFGASAAFAIGLFQYRKAQQWKRAEWVAQEMKLILGDETVQMTLILIDWSGRRVKLFPNKSVEAERYARLSDEEIARALEHHGHRVGGFSEQEAAVRDIFDRFLDNLERLSSYVKTGLVTLSDVRPYLSYWANRICETSSGARRLVNLRTYMSSYGFDGALELLQALADRNDTCLRQDGSARTA